MPKSWLRIRNQGQVRSGRRPLAMVVKINVDQVTDYVTRIAVDCRMDIDNAMTILFLNILLVQYTNVYMFTYAKSKYIYILLTL